MLHIISHSLFKSRSASAGLALLTPGDAVLLVGDGIYSVMHEDVLAHAHIYALTDDRVTRGLKEHDHVRYIDYAEMVSLTEQHTPIVTWS